MPKKLVPDKYDHDAIEGKWRKAWEEKGMYQAEDFSKKPKFYLLVEFPYPSGAGLHVGHARSWSAMDALARKHRMQGQNVLFPMGWDAFGLPAENYALKTHAHPSTVVPQNIARFKEQCRRLGFSFDWSREINTTDPKYYHWTQWIFIQLFKKGLAYQDEVPVNWCPFCKTNLADEEVLPGGTHERCGTSVEIRKQRQWLLRITKYADRLLADLRTVNYAPQIALQQVNWIGRKEWTDINYGIEGTKATIVVSTTRPDTNFGATFIVIAPEHPLLADGANLVPEKLRKAVKAYVQNAAGKTVEEREREGRKKTGVFTGLYAINSLNRSRLPIWVADFVLPTVGTGAVVGVPGHDRRDFEFAQEFKLPIIRVVVGRDGDTSPIKKLEQVQEEEGTMINSEFLDGSDIKTAINKMMAYLEERGWGKRVIRYHLHDWIFSRQHYWGEPIPIVHCPKCGAVPVPEKDLPLELPYLASYEPTETGESPLAKVAAWVNTRCPKCGTPAKRETDTMPNWAGSNWYYIRFIDPQNSQALADRKKMDYWLPVDLYQGGFEHTTLHLLYSRFIYKFLYDLGVVPNPEPYAARQPHGIVLGPDGRKMSKSFGNVVNPEDIIKKYGADALRLYEMFMGPFDQTITWNEESLAGCRRFLDRVWQLSIRSVSDYQTAPKLAIKLEKTIAKVSGDVENFKFNTLIAALMEFINAWSLWGQLSRKDYDRFLCLLAPFAPFITEELYQQLGAGGNGLARGNFVSIHEQKWPEYDPSMIAEGIVTVVVQINGRIRDKIEVNGEQETVNNQKGMEKRARELLSVRKYLEGKRIIKVIQVPGKIINFVTN